MAGMTEPELTTTRDMDHQAEMAARAANELVRLKNGSEEVFSEISVTMLILERLLDENPSGAHAIHELVMVCHDSDHKPFGNLANILKDVSLVGPDDRVDDSTRNIVLSAVQIKMPILKLVNPIEGK